MPRLGPEFIGKLPPGAAEDLADALEQYRESAREGIVKGVQILPGPGCAVAEAQAGQVYPVDQVPSLPLPGCRRAPCCACDYCPVM